MCFVTLFGLVSEPLTTSKHPTDAPTKWCVCSTKKNAPIKYILREIRQETEDLDTQDRRPREEIHLAAAHLRLCRAHN